METSQDGSVQPRTDGTQAVIGVLLALLGVVAAANPESALLQALKDVVPQLAHAVPTLVTACGAVVAALSQPPKLGRK